MLEAGVSVALLAAGLAGLSVPASAEPGCTGPESRYRLYVTVTGINAAQGLIAVTLYADDPHRFLAKRGSLYVGRVPASAPTTRMCIHVPKPGTYALAVYHDADSNRKINRSALGLPREGFGFSNNPPTFFSIPSFRKTRLAVPADGTETTVKLRYP